MSYQPEGKRRQGVGAIAAADPALSPRRELALFRRGDPELDLPVRSTFGAPRRVGPGVFVESANTTRPPVLLSGLHPGQAPLGRIPIREQNGGGGGGGGHGGGGRPGKTLAGRFSIAGMKSSASMPPSVIWGRPVIVSKSPRGVGGQMGTGIGQPNGPVASTPPSPYGVMTAPPVSSWGSGGGGDVGPVLEEYPPEGSPPIQTFPATATATAPTSPGAPKKKMSLLLPIAGGALLLYLLLRKRKRH